MPISQTPVAYRKEAEEITDFLQSSFYDSEAHLYRPWLPPGPGDLPYDYMWGNGVMFTVMVSATRYDPVKYGKTLADFTSALHRYWDETGPVPGFKDTFFPKSDAARYYDDNAWVVLGFVEAYEVTGDASYLDWARKTQAFVLSGWDDRLGGGIYWREDKQTKNTCANAPAAAAAARLYLVGHDEDQLEWAKRIVDWTASTLQDADGLFWDNISLDGKIDRKKWTYNSALMIRANTLLFEATHEEHYLQASRRIADAGITAWADPATGGFADNARFNHLFSEALLRLYDATGDLRYLNAVRKDAAFALRYVRDPEGGFFDTWKRIIHTPSERKELIETAAAARLFWLLAPYPDPSELLAEGQDAAERGDADTARDLLRQASESDAEADEARRSLEALG